MIDGFLARLRDPRFGMVFVTAVIALLMASHWPPMAVPAVVVIGLALVRPLTSVRPIVWWGMALLWFGAIVIVQERMEDHVPLFAVWLVALAVSLAYDDDRFLDRAAWQARVLLGVAFAAAVAWKLYFGTYLNGVTLWTYILVDTRFQPLATAVGLPDTLIEQDRAALSELLAGSVDAVPLEASAVVTWAIVATAVLTLLVEIVIAAAHLWPDSSRLAALRLPSIVLFGVITYGVVPVLPFAVLLATLAVVVARWRPQVMWVIPVLVLVSVTRLGLLQVS